MTEKELEKAIKKIYGNAYVELAKKTEAYFKASELRDKKMKQDLLNGVITEKEYNTWKINQTLIGKRWEEYSDVIATDMLNADNLARETIKGSLAVTMADGMNRAMWEASKIGTLEAGFTLYDKNAVMRLIKDKPEILPALKPDSPTERAIREGRIKRWNKQHLRSELTQGILQGESTGKIAKRMQNVVGMEQRASMRNARTAMTSAFNAGKEAGYKEAEDMGIELEQMWVAIYDDRTRHEHRMLDGQIRKVGEPFEIDGYEIGFPGDPSGEPEMVYNCRCRVVAITAGLKAVDPDIYKRPANLEVEDQEYQEWKDGYQKPESKEKQEETEVIKPIIEKESDSDIQIIPEDQIIDKKELEENPNDFVAEKNADVPERFEDRIEDVEKMTVDEISSLFVDKDSYLLSPEYRDKKNELNELWEEKQADDKKKIELNEELKNEMTVKPRSEWNEDEQFMWEVMREKPTTYTERGEEILDELKQLRKKESEYEERTEPIRQQLETIRRRESRKEREEWNEHEHPFEKGDVNKEYQGFSTEMKISFDEDLKNGIGFIAEMSPDEYLDRISIEIFNSTRERTIVESAVEIESDMIKKYARMMAEGTKFNMGYIDYNREEQEGRHRAIAAKLLGIKKIPVYIRGR